MTQRRYMQRYGLVALATAVVMAALGWNGLFADPTQSESQQRPFTQEFMLESCTLSPDGSNPYFSLEPGHQLILAGEDDKEELELIVTVLSDTEIVSVGGLGDVLTRVVEEREWIDGELAEVSRNFFVLCVETNAVYYFGEDVDIYEDGIIVSHEGAWRAGVAGAQPGLIMPGTFLLGARYFQEMAPEVAMDRAENAAHGLTIEVPAGTFEGSVMVFETSALASSDRSIKIYAPGVGLIVDDAAQLVEWHPAP